MAARFVNVDRQTPMLLAPDMRDWVGEDDLVHFVIAAVERLPLSTFAVNEKGCGDKQYPPHMMLALLIYCYANGIFGSRRIERATYRDVAVRYLTADTHPDHDTICAFRRHNLEAIAAAFVEVLELAREMQLLQVGMVSIDGTHIKANASKDKNLTYERAQQLRTQLKRDVKELLQRAEQADRKDEDPQRLPREIARREKLLQKMETARAQMEARAQARAQAERTEYERKLAERQQRESWPKGRPPKRPGGTTPGPKEQVNLTDADARIMRKSQRESFTQSYNAQVVVDAGGSQLIVGQRVSNCASDAGELEPDLESIPPSLGQPHTVLADCGYTDAKVFKRMARERPELDLYVSVRREEVQAPRRYDYRPLHKKAVARRLSNPLLCAMAEKLKTPQGRKIYRQRACTVEPVFGIIKAVLGFRQFLMRGLKKVSAEWNLVCLAYNLKRLYRLAAALKVPSVS